MTLKQIEFQSVEYSKSLLLRNEVLRKPLGLDISDDDISDEVYQVHFVAIEKDEVVGTVSLVSHYQIELGKLRQMATAEDVRGKGYGKQLVSVLEEYCAQNQMTKVVLHARHYAVGFYEKLGYEITSDVFQEVGIDHFVMEKIL